MSIKIDKTILTETKLKTFRCIDVYIETKIYNSRRNTKVFYLKINGITVFIGTRDACLKNQKKVYSQNRYLSKYILTKK